MDLLTPVHHMNVDAILTAFNDCQVEYLLIGGMNFLLRHAPVLTFDVDLWIHDTPENLGRCETALGRLEAEWGADDADWGPVGTRRPGWLTRQGVFALLSPQGPIDVFRSVPGLGDWRGSRVRAVPVTTASGAQCWAIDDRDLLRCQMALPAEIRKADRIAALQRFLQEGAR